MSEKKIRLDDIMPLIRESLNEGREVTFSPRGTSMLPFLKEGRDTVTLTPPPEKLKKYDVPLYQRENGQYILHRVVRVGDTYTCVGDNQFVLEKGVEHSQIIGVCASFVRKGRKQYPNAPKWRLYAKVWHYSRPARRIWRALRVRAARLKRKIKS